MITGGFVVVSQQAGPLVKAYATDRAGFVRWNRGDSPGEARKRCGPALARTTRDKLELRLALFGYEGIFYTLTFVPEDTPTSWAETKKRWDVFLRRLKRYRAKKRLSTDFDYIYRIEHLHTDRDWSPGVEYRDNWHLHCFLRKSDFTPNEVCSLWDFGRSGASVWDYRRVHQEGGYRGLAEYFTKEVPDVGRHPWGASRSLSKKIPTPKVEFNRTGQIHLPAGGVPLPIRDPGPTPWGVFQYCRYLTN